MKRPKIPFVLNICLFLLEVGAFVWMAADNPGSFFTEMLIATKYFTFDANVLMTIVTLICIVEEGLVVFGKKKDMSKFSYVLKLTATAAITFSMLIVVLYLSPANGPSKGYFFMFRRYNLIMHFLAPVLAMVVFIPYEQSDKIDFGYTFVAMIPALIYAIYYVATTLVHTTDGVIDPEYDWYAFFLTWNSVYYLLPLFLIGAYTVGYKMWKYNGGKRKRKRL